MKVYPISSLDIIGRYRFKNNKVIDTFTDAVLYQGSNARAIAQQCERVGVLNSHIIDYNQTHKAHPAHLLEVVW